MPNMINCKFDILLSENVPHILEKIFLSLDFTSFLSCLGVSKTWNKVLTSKSLLEKSKRKFGENIKLELRFAAQSGQADLIRNILTSGLVSKEDLDFSAYRKRSPLMQATTYGHEEIAIMLLDAGADPNGVDATYSTTPLHEACKQGHEKFIKLLIDAGARPTRTLAWKVKLNFPQYVHYLEKHLEKPLFCKQENLTE